MKLKNLNKYLPKKKRKISKPKYLLKPFILFGSWYNNLTPIKVSLIIFAVVAGFLLITNYFVQPKITATSETVMQQIYKQEHYVNSMSILIVGLAIRQFIVLNWMRYRKKPPAILK